MSNQESRLKEKEIDELYDRAADWYNQIHLHYLIARQSYKREFAIMSQDGMMRRTLRVHNAQGFQHIMRCWHVLDRLANGRGLEKFYRSAAIYDNGVPYQNPDLSTNIQSKIWNSSHISHIVGYDLFIDIDDHQFNNFKVCRESMQLVHEYFMELNLPHEINFSGQGFHIITPYNYLPAKSFDPEEKNNIYEFCLKIGKHINKKITELSDCSVFEARRMIKIPYTLALYENDLLVCTPLTDEKDIYNCRIDDFTPESVDINDGFKLFYDDKKVIRYERDKIR